VILKHILTHSILSTLAFCGLHAHTQPNAQDPEKAPRPGQVVIPSSTTPQYAHSIPSQEQKRDGVFRKLNADTVVVNNTLTAENIKVQHFTIAQTTFENLDVLQTVTTKNLFVTSGAQITGPLDMAGNPIINISTAQAQEFIGTALPSAPAALLTGQGTTQAPALRLLGLPNTPTPTDTVLTLDSAGNVINSGTTIGSIAGGTSSNVPGALVQRNVLDGGFSAGTIAANLVGYHTGNVSGNVIGNLSGVASANVLKAGDTMTGMLHINNPTAPALRLSMNALSAPTDYVVAIDSSGNITESSVQIGSLGTSGTSGNVPGTLVLRNGLGNFAAGTITAGLLGNVTGDVYGNVVGNLSGNVSGNVVGTLSGAASANVLKIGDTMSGQLRITDASNAVLVLTGQGTTQAPALRMLGTPNTPTPSDTILTLDGAGNVINSGATIGSLSAGTSSNVPNTLVLRDNLGNFAAGIITAGLIGNVTGNVVGNLSGVASANVLKAGDTMTGMLHINNLTAPALRLSMNALSAPTDYVVAIDSSGNITESSVQIGSLGTSGTSGNVPGTLVLRNGLGNFAAGTITAGLFGNVTGDVYGNVVGNLSGVASANVLKSGDTMSGQLRITDASNAALVLTGQGTAQAPALRMFGIPNTPLASDTILTLDGSGNVINSGTTIGSLAGGTSSNVPNTLVARDNSGNFATSAITLNAGSTGATSLNFAGSAGTGLYSPGANQLALAVNSAQKLYANSTGVGIGTTSPITQFTVGGSLLLAGSTGTGGASRSVYVQGRYAYVADSNGNSMSIIDVSDPSSPVTIGTQTGLSGAVAVYVQGRYAYVANDSGNSMSVIDVSNPRSPAVIGSVSVTSPQALYIQGRYAYVLNGFPSNRMSIIDISNPSSPVLVSVQTGIDTPKGIFVQGGYAYVVLSNPAQMQIIDVRNPSAPALVGTLALTSTPTSIYVQGRYAYAALSDETMPIIDVSNLSSPAIVGTFVASFQRPGAVYVQGRYAYIVSQSASSSVSVVDVSNPTNPALVARVGGSIDGRSIFVQGRYAYLATGFGGGKLQIVDLGGAYIQQLETGGLETGTLASRDNVAIGNDLDVKGGATIAANLLVSGQITAMNVSGSATTPDTISPLRLVNVPTGTNNALSVDASGYVTQTSSSRRFKENIVPLSTESDLLYTLTPVKYDFKLEHSGRKNLYGFIAEDVAQAYPSIVNCDGQGLPCNYVADTLHALTIKEVQKQKQKLDAHDGIIKALLITIASMQAQIATLQVR
jgi:hypothetical protein